MTASQKRGAIHIGVTHPLGRRMPERKNGAGSRPAGQLKVWTFSLKLPSACFSKM